MYMATPIQAGRNDATWMSPIRRAIARLGRVSVTLQMVAVLALGGCAATRPSMSYVAPGVTAVDAQTLATDTVRYLADQLPPARTTLSIDKPAEETDALTKVMLEKLRLRGYGIESVDAKAGSKAGQGTPFRYVVTPFDKGIVLRLQFKGGEASKFYPRATGGELLTGQPFTVRNGG